MSRRSDSMATIINGYSMHYCEAEYARAMGLKKILKAIDMIRTGEGTENQVVDELVDAAAYLDYGETEHER